MQAGIFLGMKNRLEKRAGPLPVKTQTVHRGRRIGWALGVLAVLLMALGLSLWMADPPPVAAFEKARHALGEARRAEADRYASAWFERAEAQWSRAFALWEQENTRWYAVRDYAAAYHAADSSLRLSEVAARQARATRDSLAWIATAGLPLVRDQLDVLRAQMALFPLDKRWRVAVADVQTYLAEGEGAFERQDYWTAAARTQQAVESIRRIGVNVSGTIQDYVATLPTWQRWQAETVAWSAQRRAPAIVVDKVAHRLYLYVNGRLQQTYDVDLGPSWLGPKRHEGDLSTPEGRYRVTRKRDRGATSYFLALEIDYPNDEDRRRFREARAQGVLPPDARIGGRIEIHGEGGRGVNWTRGCVALHNADMKALFDATRVGTPVTIVGALEQPALAEEIVSMLARGDTLMNAMPFPERRPNDVAR